MTEKLSIFKKIYTLSKIGDVVLLENQSEAWGYLAVGSRKSISFQNGVISIKHGDNVSQVTGNPWEELEQFKKSSDWIFGYFGYDLKNNIEVLRSKNYDDIKLPDLYFVEPESLYRIDFKALNLEFIQGDLIDFDSFPDLEIPRFDWVSPLKCKTQKPEYIRQIEQAKEQIFEGTFYEINLSRQQVAEYEGEPLALYLQMRNRGPVPFASFMSFENTQICCASPERFLMKSGNELISEPIKGTTSVDLPAEEIEEILLSEKNRAENLMIVDLVRHDFNRVCKKSSVKVDPIFEIRPYSTVHHLVSTVRGDLKDDVSAVQAIKACFPMGSMTGAPKISAMKAIDDFENYKRGLYSGAIGYFTPDDDFDFNVVIRTGICKDTKCFYSSGGAITSDSDPEDEWEETRLKTLALRPDV